MILLPTYHCNSTIRIMYTSVSGHYFSAIVTTNIRMVSIVYGSLSKVYLKLSIAGKQSAGFIDLN